MQVLVGQFDFRQIFGILSTIQL